MTVKAFGREINSITDRGATGGGDAGGWPKKRGAALFNFNNSIVRMTLHGFKTKFAATHLSYKVIDQIHYTHMDP